MSPHTLLWLAGAALVVIAVGQWIVLRSRYLHGLDQQRTRHAQQLQTAGQYIDQAKRQIAQLQLDLGNTRSQLARMVSRQASSVRASSDAQAARRETGGTVARRGEPSDGFADTLPAPQYPHDTALLKTYPKPH